jgi:hypothetical protein
MDRLLSGLALAVFCLGLCACDPIESLVERAAEKKVEEHLAKQTARISILNDEIRSLHESLNKTNEKVSTLELQHSFMDYRIDAAYEAAASVSEGGYSLGRNSFGPFLVTIERIVPHLDGYKVTLNIGNPTMILFSGAEFEVGWGLQYGTPGKTYAEVGASKKKKKFSSANDFAAGSYSRMEIVLTPAKPEEVKTLEVSVKWDRLSMRKPPAQSQ